LNKCKLVSVLWGDAYGGSEWRDIDELLCEPLLVRDVGWLVKQNKEGIYLSSSISRENGSYGSRKFIPKGMIKKITTIRGHTW
jgi:hypothetical protein